jgi:Tol biopolymer transport system component
MNVYLRIALVGLLSLLVAIPASATFPGKNGRIAFIQDGEVFTMNPDGSGVAQLTHLTPDNSASWESWSPDGKQIVFSEFPSPDFSGQLWVMNADGRNPRLLLAETGVTEVRASFSPDGQSIIFSRGRNFNPDNGNPFVVEMYRINLDGSGLTALTRHEVLGLHDYGPKYSPDGQTITFQCDDRNGVMAAVFSSNTDGRNIRQVTPSAISARRPDWSPDGKRIAFQTHCCNPENPTIAVINRDGSGLLELTRNDGDFATGAHDANPSWSPEGDAIVFERQMGDSIEIFEVRVNGEHTGQAFMLHVSKSAPNQLTHIKGSRERNRQRSRLREIEQGGMLARWGAAPN